MKRGMKDYVTPGMAVVDQQPAMSLFSGSDKEKARRDASLFR